MILASISCGSPDTPDLLDDSMRRFYLDRLEYEWSTISYIRYLYPLKQWRNKYGERMSIDGLVKVAPYAYVMNFNAYLNCCGAQTAPVGGGAAKLSVKTDITPAGALIFTLSDGRKISIQLLPVAEGLIRDKLTSVPEAQRDRLVLTSDTGGIKADLRLSNLHLQVQGKQTSLQNAYGILLFTP